MLNDIYDILAIPMLFIALYLVLRISRVTGNRNVLFCFGAFFVIGVIRRLVMIFVVDGGDLITGILDALLFINLFLQLLGFYLLWRDIKKLVGKHHGH